MAIEFEVDNPEEFEMMVEGGDIRISKALVKTILKNLKSKKNACFYWYSKQGL
jgi:hypothetical protein